jgi:hypothetical protein
MSVLSLSGNVTAGQAEAYVAALLDLLGSRDPVDVLRQTPDALSARLAGLAPEKITRPEAPGKWSMRDVVQHLADSELVGGFRLRITLAQDRPPVAGYDQDLWADRLRYREIEVSEALEQFHLLRRLNLRYWAGLTEDDLARVAVHGERGEESLGLLRRLYAGHDLAHRRQLERIRLL